MMDERETSSSEDAPDASDFDRERGGPKHIDREQESIEWLPLPPLAYRATKRAIDLVGSLLGLILLSPVLIMIAVLVRLTSAGPVLFVQTRVGQRGRPFKIWKFRTMYLNSDPERNRGFIGELISGRYGPIGEGPLFKMKNDPRVTRIGRFLRRTSLDDVPQLWNVLRGELSLVGPRAAFPYEWAATPKDEDEQFSFENKQRLSVRPGITGLWQISGRSGMRHDEIVELDMEYVRHPSLLLDMLILFRWFSAAIQRDKAY